MDPNLFKYKFWSTDLFKFWDTFWMNFLEKGDDKIYFLDPPQKDRFSMKLRWL